MEYVPWYRFQTDLFLHFYGYFIGLSKNCHLVYKLPCNVSFFFSFLFSWFYIFIFFWFYLFIFFWFYTFIQYVSFILFLSLADTDGITNSLFQALFVKCSFIRAFWLKFGRSLSVCASVCLYTCMIMWFVIFSHFLLELEENGIQFCSNIATYYFPRGRRGHIYK